MQLAATVHVLVNGSPMNVKSYTIRIDGVAVVTSRYALAEDAIVWAKDFCESRFPRWELVCEGMLLATQDGIVEHDG